MTENNNFKEILEKMDYMTEIERKSPNDVDLARVRGKLSRGDNKYLAEIIYWLNRALEIQDALPRKKFIKTICEVRNLDRSSVYRVLHYILKRHLIEIQKGDTIVPIKNNKNTHYLSSFREIARIKLNIKEKNVEKEGHNGEPVETGEEGREEDKGEGETETEPVQEGE